MIAGVTGDKNRIEHIDEEMEDSSNENDESKGIIIYLLLNI